MMTNNFHHQGFRPSILTIEFDEIGSEGANLVSKLDEDPSINYVVIRGRIYNDCRGIEFIMNAVKNHQAVKVLQFGANITNANGAKCIAAALKDTNISTLYFYSSRIGTLGTKYMANVLKDTCITDLCLANDTILNDGIKYLAEGLKDTKVMCLHVGSNGIRASGMKYLTDALQDTNITYIDLGNNVPGYFKNEIKDEGVMYLADRLKDTNLSKLALNGNKISDDGVKYLADRLKDTCVTSLYLRHNQTSDDGAQHFARILPETQIIDVSFDNHNIDSATQTAILDAVSQNKTNAKKIREKFVKLMVQNTETHDLEFMIPEDINDFDISDYLYIIRTFRDNDKVKGHIFDVVRQHGCRRHPNIVKKISVFIATMADVFSAFIEKKFPALIDLLKSSFQENVNFVKEAETMNLNEAVRHLLSHRTLYYINESEEISHPYIYKLMEKYGMPFYSGELETEKKKTVVSFYQNHQEIEGAQEVIDLFESKC